MSRQDGHALSARLCAFASMFALLVAQQAELSCDGIDPDIRGSHNMREVGVGAKDAKTPNACHGTMEGETCPHTCDYGFIDGFVLCTFEASTSANITYQIEPCVPDPDTSGCKPIAYGLVAMLMLLLLLFLIRSIQDKKRTGEQAVLDWMKNAFDEMDRNHDGTVTRDELAAYAKGRDGRVPPDDAVDICLSAMDSDNSGTISEAEFMANYRSTLFMRHRRSQEMFCSPQGNKPPAPRPFRKVGGVDLSERTCRLECSSSLVKVYDNARMASNVAVKTAFGRCFMFALVTGAVSQARIFMRLDAFKRVLTEISTSDTLTSMDVSHMMDGGFLYLGLDSLTENSWNVFSKMLFLPVFLLVYFINQEVAQWRKLGSIMWTIQSHIENSALMLSSAQECEADSDTAELLYKYYRHVNLVHVLQYRQLDPRLSLECGEELKGLVNTGLLMGTNRTKLRLAGSKDRTLAMSWVIEDATEIIDKEIIKGPFVGNFVGNLLSLRSAMANMHNEMLNRPPVTMVGMMRVFVDGLLSLGIVGFAWSLTSLGETTPSHLALLVEDACGIRYVVWPMLGMFTLCMFFTTMFILANALQDPLGNDLDDYDIDSLLLSTEATLYTLIRSKLIGTVENVATEADLPVSVNPDENVSSTLKGWSIRERETTNPTFDTQ